MTHDKTGHPNMGRVRAATCTVQIKRKNRPPYVVCVCTILWNPVLRWCFKQVHRMNPACGEQVHGRFLWSKPFIYPLPFIYIPRAQASYSTHLSRTLPRLCFAPDGQFGITYQRQREAKSTHRQPYTCVVYLPYTRGGQEVIERPGSRFLWGIDLKATTFER